MIDAIKDYLAPKRFGVVAYVCLIVHFLCGLVFTAVTSALSASEIGKFSCVVDAKSTASYKTYVEKTCYSRYQQTFNSPLPLYGFVLLSIGLTVLVSVIYSLAVSSHVDEIADRDSNGSEEPRTNSEGTRNGFYVLYFYLIHLVARSVFGILFTVLQYVVFYPYGFNFEFRCSLPTTKATSHIAKNSSIAQFNVTSTTCENSTASEKELWGIIVSISNTVFALVMLVEVIYLCRRFPILNCRSQVGRIRDTEFITVHLLRKRYTRFDVELTTVLDSKEFYKRRVLNSYPSLGLEHGPKANLDDIINIRAVIHTERDHHKFSKEMDRHEIYDVYMRVPENQIRFEEIKDLFYPGKDTDGEYPRTILAVGRPGIGKTVLTEKIIHDWANGIDEFYKDKIAFCFKFRWFSFDEMKNISLKTFLCYGAGLSEEELGCILEEILNESKKAILIFDGFDEFNGDFMRCLDRAQMFSSEPTTCMSAMTLFIKLVSGDMLHEATILVTSRPTAADLYTMFNFDRSIEVMGFTTYTISVYVSRFCKNIGNSELAPKIWKHIRSSSELLSLCYIPVNCYIVCDTMTACLSDSSNDTSALPTTLSKLYQTAIHHLGQRHSTRLSNTALDSALKELQSLAFVGIEKTQLVFNQNQFDEQMRMSGLVNSLSNPTSQLQTQFCFTHYTIQEFLAARHVIEKLSPDEIKTFISTHINSGKWHLVLQFIAGLLGEKKQMSRDDYLRCASAFAQNLSIRDRKINLNDYGHVLVMKCLREVDDEEIVKEVCEATALNEVETLHNTEIPVNPLSSSDWAAVTFVCKFLRNLVNFDCNLFSLMQNDFPSYMVKVSEFLQQRCKRSLILRGSSDGNATRLIRDVTNSKCILNHHHAELHELRISILMCDADLSNICTFLENGNARYLQILDVSHNKIGSSGLEQLGAVLAGGHCDALRYLDVSRTELHDHCLARLCRALLARAWKINTLVLAYCRLTAECMRSLSVVLRDKNCNLTDLFLDGNYIGDEGVRRLCKWAIAVPECKLTKLSLFSCRLTDDCVRRLCEILQGINCSLTELQLGRNDFTEESWNLLRAVRETENCKARGLVICNHLSQI